MLHSLLWKDSALQMFGPRGQAWRPASSVHGALLRKAIVLAAQGHSLAAIQAAEEAWVAREGHMHDVAFRVVTKSEQIEAIAMRALKDDPRVD